MTKEHHSAYDEEATARCERVLVTLLGDIGPWGDRIYLAGGLAPRYIVGRLPEGARPHVGTTDVDLVIGLTVSDEGDEAYRTLENNLRKARFEPENSFRWSNKADGVTVIVEFMCDTEQVEAGRVFKPRHGLGTKFGAFNVRGARLIAKDFTEQSLEADRIDGGGRSRVTARVANILVYTVLKILAFQDRHENKDAYDLIYCLLNFGDGPADAGRAAANSAIYDEAQVQEALRLLAERFSTIDQDGPHAYAAFLAEGDDRDEWARLRREAVAVVRAFLSAAAT